MALLMMSTTGSLCNAFVKNTLCRTMHRKQNHYEVLKLSQNCSHKDIKRAYYELSKKYHPDRNHNSSPKLFLEVSEAYKILSKPEARHRYDMSLLPINQRYRADYYDQYMRRNRMDEPAFFRRRDPVYEYDCPPPPYTRGERFANSLLLPAVLLFMAVGITLQVLTFRHAMRIRKDELKISQALSQKSLDTARAAADENGNQNQLQIKLLEQRFRDNGISLE